MERDRDLFERFGGVRPMAEALGEPPSTVQSWKTAGRIPATKQPDVLKRGGEMALGVTAHDVVFPLARRPDADDDDAYRAAPHSVADETRPLSPAGAA